MKSVKARLVFLWIFSWQSETEDVIKSAFRAKMEDYIWLPLKELPHTQEKEKRKQQRKT